MGGGAAVCMWLTPWPTASLPRRRLSSSPREGEGDTEREMGERKRRGPVGGWIRGGGVAWLRLAAAAAADGGRWGCSQEGG